MKQNRSWEVSCGFMVWTMSNLEDSWMFQSYPSSGLKHSHMLAKVIRVPSMLQKEKCFKEQSINLEEKGSRAMAEWFKNENRFTESGARKAITNPC